MLKYRQSLRRPLWALSALGLGSALVLAPGVTAQEQEATPADYAEEGMVSAIVMDAEGNEIGAAVFIPIEGGTQVEIEVQGLPEGDHGIHIHETGVCDPGGDEAFSSAGGHFNPTGATHGGPMIGDAGATPQAEQSHAGDLGNITIGSDGSGSLSFSTNAFMVEEGAENSLRDDDGSAIVVHESPDDLMTDPSGNSGARIACGVIFAPGQSESEDVVATPTVDTVATPSADD
jgi:Cu-Zn family superoxide dismutase